MTATIRYQEVVMWKKPGGHHHVKILHKGDKVGLSTREPGRTSGM